MDEGRPCPCPRVNCVRHGKCGECRAHHASEKKHPPYCDRQKLKAEKLSERANRRAQR